MRASVVVCSIDPAKFARVSASYRARFGSALVQLIGIHDARSLAEAYNRGLAAAQGEVVVFSHDDIELLAPDFAARLEAHLARYDIVGIAGTTRLVGGGWHFAGAPYDAMLVVAPHPDGGKPTLVIEHPPPLVVPGAQALDGVFLAARAEAARALAFDAATFDHFHLYDLDFTFRAHQAGLALAICRDLVLRHDSQGRYDARWDIYRERFERKFAGALAPALPRRPPRILNVPLDDDILRDAAELARLCSPATLERMCARLAGVAGA